MSTWQILSDTGQNFRWSQIDNEPNEEPNAAPIQRPHRLPSMADLLLQGYSKIEENDGNDAESPPMFRTGLGKSVVVKQSSLSKASSILGDLMADGGCSKIIAKEGGHSKSPLMFHSGLGNSVVVKQSSLSKASSILNDEADDSADQGCPKVMENGGLLKSHSMFQTGFRKSIALKQSSLSIVDTGQLHGRNSGCSFANSMFKTGSGKAVNISASGLIRANKLLGLEENNDRETSRCFEQTMKQSNSSRAFGRRSSSHPSMKMGVADKELKDGTSSLISPLKVKSGILGSEFMEVTPDNVHSVPKTPSIKFHTAGGKSISVSSDALQRARSLLGDPDLGSFLNEGDAGEPVFSIFKDRKSDGNSNKENCQDTYVSHQEIVKSKRISKNFISPLSTSSQKQVSLGLGKNLIRKFDAEVHESTSRLYNDVKCQRNSPSNKHYALHTVRDLLTNGTGLRTNPLKKSTGRPLVDISNNINMDDRSNKNSIGVKRILGRSSVSPFKRPRDSKFITPMNSQITLIPNGSSTLAPYKNRVSSRYPFQAPRKYFKEYFGVPPFHTNMLEHLPESIRRMNPETAEQHSFQDGCGFDSIGKKAFSHMLLQSGASVKYVSEKWVANHYKWIVWKLACYERCYYRNFLTVSNVIEELKYRYEREVNHGHRSAIKRILGGDAPPSSVLVLCISSIQSNCEAMVETSSTPHGVDSSTAANIELSDGWYSVNALLDVHLSKKLAAGKLFVGQKLRISGAGLYGWAGPVSPLEASRTISLVLHINGTYRAHWAERLGFCKSGGSPLAFRCIKSSGGAVPSTFVGIQRIYPVLYRERLSNGGCIIRSERMEAKMQQLYNQRRSNVAEGIMSEFQRVDKDFHLHNDDSEEGAKILKILETAAEPEVLMAEMSSEQLSALSIYQAKLEATRQSDMHKSIEKALEDAGLSGREVTPFMRVSVVGLTIKSNQPKCCPQKGLITIWNPTEKQQSELVEGQAYAISGLTPLSSDSDTLYLKARGSTTKWLPLSPSAIEHFQPFFSPRKPVSLSNLGDVPFSSEFDIAGLVVFVGEVYTAAHKKKQWVFVTDGSIHDSHSKEPSYSLLAISFCSPYIDCESYIPINFNLAGSTAGFCNLIKRAEDQMNHLWVAEATENSTYSLTYDRIQCTHLKEAAASAKKWVKISSLTIEKLKGKILSIIGNCKD